MNDTKNLTQVASQLTEYWSPKVVATVDDSFVKVAKVKGEFVWHDHLEDEFFMVLAGELTIRMPSGDVTIRAGECYTVPKRVEHQPVAEDDCLLMLFEKQSTQHTGKVQSHLTKSVSDQMKS